MAKADGTAAPCYVTHLLAKHKHDGPGAEEELEIIKGMRLGKITESMM